MRFYSSLLILEALSLEIIELELLEAGLNDVFAMQELRNGLLSDFWLCDFFTYI
jgi:hypothetical protein